MNGPTRPVSHYATIPCLLIFVQEGRDDFEAKVERIKRHVDTVRRLGIKHMRHDVTAFTHSRYLQRRWASIIWNPT
ncbi:hypothetical protein [Paenibacillus glucanolyticus]|uniref:hypothetical protein n=1 Tax=Paenibacillus glucanolyticus TaxID=59843 RepID=UPI001E60DF7D|nr:hypothetical protein [Paenibacillus glucanolyticus]